MAHVYNREKVNVDGKDGRRQDQLVEDRNMQKQP